MVLTTFLPKIFPSLSNVVDLQYNPNTVWVLSGVYSHTDSVGFDEGLKKRSKKSTKKVSKKVPKKSHIRFCTQNREFSSEIQESCIFILLFIFFLLYHPPTQNFPAPRTSSDLVQKTENHNFRQKWFYAPERCVKKMVLTMFFAKTIFLR